MLLIRRKDEITKVEQHTRKGQQCPCRGPWTDSLVGPTPLMRRIAKISKLTVNTGWYFLFHQHAADQKTHVKTPHEASLLGIHTVQV